VTNQGRIRLFLDSNVLTGGIVSPWGLDKATLSLCAAKVCRLVLAEAVRDEVEENPSSTHPLIRKFRQSGRYFVG
jgi:predicted nucleic acid-binding protein